MTMPRNRAARSLPDGCLNNRRPIPWQMSESVCPIGSPRFLYTVKCRSCSIRLSWFPVAPGDSFRHQKFNLAQAMTIPFDGQETIPNSRSTRKTDVDKLSQLRDVRKDGRFLQ